MKSAVFKKAMILGTVVGLATVASFSSAASASVTPEAAGVSKSSVVRQGDIPAKPWVPTTLRSAAVDSIKVGPMMMNGVVMTPALQSPARNAIYVCRQVVPIPGGGVIDAPDHFTLANTPWVSNGNVITLSKIKTVPGKVQLAHSFKVTTTKTTRNFKGNGIPNHPIGVFPIPTTLPCQPRVIRMPPRFRSCRTTSM